MNLADPELELIDPTPNIHSLFVHFDELFFSTKLLSRALVRWSKRMYSCAGVCRYEGRGGLCDIALSEPLLKLRPRKDLIETLLHEMIHAFLFITNKDNDRDGHGPIFQAHMHRINRAAGLNISIYHDFHDEVNLYLKHWWRCNGRCQTMKPYFGVVRRSLNRAPGPSDHWWANHTRMCGGTFVKIKEPEKKQKPNKKNDKGKINADITKYINNNIENTVNKNINKGVNKENKFITNVNIVNAAVPLPSKSPEVINLWNTDRRRTNSTSVIEKVRNVWINKQIPSLTQVPVKLANEPNMKKHKAESVHVESPPKKIKKIDDYFKITASSILKDVYGKEFIISQSSNSTKLKAVPVSSDSDKVEPVNAMESFVNCPSCNTKVNNNYINRHLDECLNKDIIEELSKEFVETTPIVTSEQISENKTIKDIVSDLHNPPFKPKAENHGVINNDTTTGNKNRLKKIVGDIQKIPSFHSKTFNHAKIENGHATIKIEDSGETQSYKDNIKKNVTSPFHIDVSCIKPSTSKKDLAEICPTCGNNVDIPMELHLNDCLGFFDNNSTIPEEGASDIDVNTNIKIEPSTSKQDLVQTCPCCGNKVDKPIEEHLDECLAFFDNNTTVPTEAATAIETIVIDDDEDDVFDETQTFNATGTKSPCPCCLKMIEVADMNDHLDVCLSSSLY